MNTHLKTNKLQRAFTLVETVIAIGIVSTVMVALVGMMPEGMKMISQAGQRTVGARIAQQLIGQLQLAKYQEISNYDGQQYYFDDQGTEVRADDVSFVYTAKIEVQSAPPKIPGDRKPSAFLRRVVVKVSDKLDGPDFSDEAAGRDYLRYPTMVVNLEDSSS
jgi:uncharacterized protein (TIGR02598 family)